MAASRYDITVELGSRFTWHIVWTDADPTAPDNVAKDIPKDLTDYTARMQIRARADSAGDPLLALTTEALFGDTGIALGGAEGTILVTIQSDDTANLNGLTSAVYDLEILDENDEPQRLLEGGISIKKEVTRGEFASVGVPPVASGFRGKSVSVSSNYEMQPGDVCVRVRAGNLTITLPPIEIGICMSVFLSSPDLFAFTVEAAGNDGFLVTPVPGTQFMFISNGGSLWYSF